MSLTLHRQAGDFAGRADNLMAQGHVAEATQLYHQAARIESDVFRDIPMDRPKTRAAIAVSMLALFLKAHAFDEGLQHGWRLLASDQPLPDFAIPEIEEILDELRLGRDEVRRGVIPLPDEYECALDGPAVRRGVAPAELVLRTVDLLSKFGFRVFEYASQIPLRRGAIEPQTRTALGVLVGEPTAGSFRFRMRFASKFAQADDLVQMSLLQAVEQGIGSGIGMRFGEILEAATHPDDELLSQLVDDASYRDVFLRMTRNLAPNGREVETLEVRRLGPVPGGTVLTPEVRTVIGRYLDRNRPASVREREQVGYLRAINLNEDWIGVGEKEGALTRLQASHELVEDTLSHLLDQLVRVTSRRHARRWVVVDVVEASELELNEEEDIPVQPQQQPRLNLHDGGE